MGCASCANMQKPQQPNEVNPQQKQNEVAKEVGKTWIREIGGFLFDKFVKDKLPQGVQKGIEVVKKVDQIHEKVQNIANVATVLADCMVKPGDNAKKAASNLNVKQIKRSALRQPQAPISAVVPNPPSRLQNPPANNSAVQQPKPDESRAGDVSCLQGGATPHIKVSNVREEGLKQSALSDLQSKIRKQPPNYVISSIIQKEEGGSKLSDAMKSRLGSKINYSNVVEPLNPELSKVQKSKVDSMIGFQDKIAEQGNQPVKGVSVKLSKIMIF